MSVHTYIGLKAWDMGFDAHLTVMYLGPMSAEERYHAREVIFDAKQMGGDKSVVFRRKIEVFNENTPVVTVQAGQDLWAMRSFFEKRGLVSPSTFPFNPHISLKFDGHNTMNIPYAIKLSHLNLY